MPEIKYRGPLSPLQVEQLTRYFSKRSKPLFAGEEKVLFLDTSIFPSIGDFNTGFSRISVKQKDDLIIVRIKEGNPSAVRRDEQSFTLPAKQVSCLLRLLHALGLREGFYRTLHRVIYPFEECRFSIKTNTAIGDHFEIELPSDELFAHPALRSLVEQFGLRLWTKEAYQREIARGMKAFPAVSLTQADLFE